MLPPAGDEKKEAAGKIRRYLCLFLNFFCERLSRKPRDVTRSPEASSACSDLPGMIDLSVHSGAETDGTLESQSTNKSSFIVASGLSSIKMYVQPIFSFFFLFG